MKSASDAFSRLLPGLLLVFLVAVLYPFCRYYVDPDGVAYFSIIRRYATGDYSHAINAYWSPLSCWLCALLVKTGMEAMPAAVLVNTAAAVGVLYATQLLFRLLGTERKLQRALSLALSVFLAYAVYKQLFADLWEVFFLLLALRVLLDEGLLQSKGLWVLLGCLGGWAYYAKAYALPFFGLQLLVLGWWRFRSQKKQLLLFWAVTLGVLALWAAPWIWLLHGRYGRWMSSSAGDLNLSWYLVGHPHFREGIGALLPPPSADAPFYWEDPASVNGATPKFYSSVSLFFLQIARLGLNVLKFLNALYEQSALMIPVYATAVVAVLSRKTRPLLPEKLQWLALSMLLFPAGFWLINFESRYIWYLLPCGMVLGSWLLEQIRPGSPFHPWRRWMALVFVLSFVSWPVWDMKSMIYTGREDYKAAQVLKENDIRGPFASDAGPGGEYQAMARLAHFSGNSYYYVLPQRVDQQRLLAELKHDNVRYYIHLQRGGEPDGFQLNDEQGKPFPEVAAGLLPGMKVFRLLP